MKGLLLLLLVCFVASSLPPDDSSEEAYCNQLSSFYSLLCRGYTNLQETRTSERLSVPLCASIRSQPGKTSPEMLQRCFRLQKLMSTDIVESNRMLLLEDFAASHPLKSLLDWMTQQGFRHSGTIHIRYSSNSGFGTYASALLTQGGELFYVPKSAVMYASSPFVSQRCRAVLQRFRATTQTIPVPVSSAVVDFSEMAVLLICEMHNPSSHWLPYLESLRFPDAPVFFTRSQIRACDSKTILQHRWRYLLPMLRLFRYVFQDAALRDLFLFSKPESASKRKSSLTPPEFLFTVAASVVLQRSHSWGAVVLVPFMDLLNYDPKAEFYYVPYSRSGSTRSESSILDDELTAIGYAVNATSPIAPGAQLFLAYSLHPMTSARLLLQYGFVPHENPNDYVTLTAAGGSDSVPVADFSQLCLNCLTNSVSPTALGTIRLFSDGKLPMTFLRFLATMSRCQVSRLCPHHEEISVEELFAEQKHVLSFLFTLLRQTKPSLEDDQQTLHQLEENPHLLAPELQSRELQITRFRILKKQLLHSAIHRLQDATRSGVLHVLSDPSTSFSEENLALDELTLSPACAQCYSSDKNRE